MKVYNYVVILLGLMVLMDFAGIVPHTGGITTVFGFVRDTDILSPTYQMLSFDPSFSTIAIYLFSTGALVGLLIGLAVAGIAIGTFAKGKLENFILLPIITTTLVLFIGAIKDVVDISISGGDFPVWIGYIVTFMGIVLVGGLMVSLWEHFRGTD